MTMKKISRNSNDKAVWPASQAAGAASPLPAGMRMCVAHARQRTVLPRATVGTARTFRHRRFGHMILIEAGFASAIVGLPARDIGWQGAWHDKRVHRSGWLRRGGCT